MIWVKLGWVTLVALVLAACHADRLAGVLAGLVLPVGRPPGPGQVAGLVLPAPLGRGHGHRRGGPWYQGRTLLPVLGKVTATRYTDRVQVRLVSGQSAADFAAQAENLAHGFGAMLCRVRSARSGAVVLEFVRRDALAVLVPALPIPAHPDLRRCRSAAARTAALAGQAARHARPDRGRDRGGEGLAPVGPGPGHLPAMQAGLVQVWPPIRS